MSVKATLLNVEPNLELILGIDDDGRRFEKIVRKAFPRVSLSLLHKAIRLGKLRIDGKKRRPEYLCKAGERLESFLSANLDESPESFSSMDLNPLPSGLIVLETNDLLFVNKPYGLLVHDGMDSLASMVSAYLKSADSHSVSFKPGPLHRLDRNTSGLITFSKTLIGATTFSKRISEITKTYLAILEGEVPESGIWENKLQRNDEKRISTAGESGSLALTYVQPLLYIGGNTLAELKLETGRTHQIRVQASAHGYPLLGDVKYGGKRSTLPYFLHAWKLVFATPFFEDIPSIITAPLPKYFIEFLQNTGANHENAVYSYLNTPDQ